MDRKEKRLALSTVKRKTWSSRSPLRSTTKRARRAMNPITTLLKTDRLTETTEILRMIMIPRLHLDLPNLTSLRIKTLHRKELTAASYNPNLPLTEARHVIQRGLKTKRRLKIIKRKSGLNILPTLTASAITMRLIYKLWLRMNTKTSLVLLILLTSI